MHLNSKYQITIAAGPSARVHFGQRENEQLTLVFDKYKRNSEKHALHANATEELASILFRHKFAITTNSAQDLQKCRFCDIVVSCSCVHVGMIYSEFKQLQ